MTDIISRDDELLVWNKVRDLIEIQGVTVSETTNLMDALDKKIADVTYNTPSLVRYTLTDASDAAIASATFQFDDSGVDYALNGVTATTNASGYVEIPLPVKSAEADYDMKILSSGDATLGELAVSMAGAHVANVPLYTVTFTTVDGTPNDVNACTIVIDGDVHTGTGLETGAGANDATTLLPAGTYTYTCSCDTYDDTTGSVEVVDGAVVETVVMVLTA